MTDHLITLIVDESKWLTASMGLALVTTALVLRHYRRSPIPARGRILIAMNLFFGVTILVMAFGHLLAVTTKLLVGTLEGPVLTLYAIGVALALPSICLVRHVWRHLIPQGQAGQTTLLLNAWLAATLLALGLHNLPLALPAVFNAGYQVNTRPAVGWGLLGLAVAGQLVLFVGSLIFLASGQSFEQFSAP